MDDLSSLAGQQFCYLTTTGRRTGSPHEIEIWFALADATFYMLHGSGMSSDSRPQPARRTWRHHSHRRLHVRGRGARRLSARRGSDGTPPVLQKYEREYSGDLSNWGRTALPVAVDLRF